LANDENCRIISDLINVKVLERLKSFWFEDDTLLLNYIQDYIEWEKNIDI